MASPPPEFRGILARLSQELRDRDIGFMLIGGQAVLLHGRPRLTEDIDVTLAVGPEALPSLLEACESLGLEPLPEDVEGFVKDTFVLPAVDPVSRIRVDLIFSTTRYEREAIERAVRVEVEGVEVPFASAEDLIIHKLFAGRPGDVEDARTVVRRQKGNLDWSYLEDWARSFAEVPGRERMPERLGKLREEGDGPR